MTSPILDISQPLGPDTPAYPGDTALRISWPAAHGGGPAAVSAITLSPHLGTHVDAPLHLYPGGADAASLSLGAFIGPCLVVDVPSTARGIAVAAVPALHEPAAPRILLRSGVWPPGAPMPAAYPAPSPELIDHLADRGVVLIGVDTPSLDLPGDERLPAHRRSLARGLGVLEGLNLASAAPGIYTLVAPPLRLVGVEASPVRALLLPAGAIALE